MDKNGYLSKLQAVLASRRAEAQNTAYKNQQRARSNSEFLALDTEEKNLVFDKGKLIANGLSTAEIDKKLTAIRQKKAKILAKLGLSPADLEPQYVCKKCNDLGYIGGQMCTCLKKMLNETLIHECGAGKDKLSDFRDFNLDFLKDEQHKTQLIKLRKKFEEVAEGFPTSSPKFIVLSGKTGVGKTFLTECLAKALIDKGYLVSFVSAFGMNNLFLSYHTTFNEQKQSYLNALIDPDVLVIDDLGTEPVLKNVTKEYLLLVLSERSRLNKLTITTTNLGMDQLLSRYDERIFSRLCNKRESFLAQIVGSDLRLK